MAAIEMISVVDENGFPTGQTKPRASVHANGDWHRTVHVWIANSRREVLFQKRSLTKESFPGAWDISAAGHIESGETSMAAAIKEVREELGISLGPQNLQFLFSQKSSSVQRSGVFIDNEISDVYMVRLDIDIEEVCIQTSEVSGVRFVPLPDVARLADHRDPAFVPHDEEYRRLYDYFLDQKK